MKNLLIKSTLLLVLVYLVACSDEGNGNLDNFDRTLILENFADNIIIPSYDQLESNTSRLAVEAGELSSTLNQATLESLRESWKAAKLSWARAEAFSFGPIDDLAVETKINNWPLNDFGLESFLSGKSTITVADVSAMPSNQVGFIAIEYLLFDEGALTKFENSPARLQLLQALATSLSNHIKSIQQEWQGDYKSTFIAADGKDLGSSMTQLANAFIESVEIVRTFKVSTPLGFRTEGVIQPGLVESRYSNFSKELIAANLEAFQDIFNGQSEVGDLNGFADYLDGLNINIDNKLLSEAINSNFESAIQAVNHLDGSLMDAVENNPLKVNEQLTELQKLIVLLKTDMMSQLGLIVTFNDNDGD